MTPEAIYIRTALTAAELAGRVGDALGVTLERKTAEVWSAELPDAFVTLSPNEMREAEALPFDRCDRAVQLDARMKSPQADWDERRNRVTDRLWEALKDDGFPMMRVRNDVERASEFEPAPAADRDTTGAAHP